MNSSPKCGFGQAQLDFWRALTLLGTFGYYGGYAYVVYLAAAGALSIGQMTSSRRNCRRELGHKSDVDHFLWIAKQALFMTDLVEFFVVGPISFRNQAPWRLRGP